ncbi:MAG: hypothetical protein HY248_01905, partial [Fimbriimonas ginsengisoli]|nr:hypothetical protein [Fimbriimonas ginsengisoli]
QALRCVEYRLPKTYILRAPAYLLAMSLRYGLMGAAASRFLEQFAETPSERRRIADLAHGWAEMVEEHVRQVTRHRLPFAANPSVGTTVGLLADQPVSAALRLGPSCPDLDRLLTVSSDEFARLYRKPILAGVSLLRRWKTTQEFRRLAQMSIHFAINFHERRQAGLDEVPEIALIGE